MNFKVYHTRNWALNSNLHFIDDAGFCKKCAPEHANGYKPFKSNYKHIANIDCDSLGDAYYFTNHIDHAWWEHENVEKIEESRSSSIGDLIEDENGKLYMIASIGFTEVEWNETDQYEVKKDTYGEYIIPIVKK